MSTHKVQLQLVASVSSELSLGSSKKRGGGEESSLVGLHDAINSSRKDGAWPLRILHVRTITYQNNPWRKVKIKKYIVLHRHKYRWICPFLHTASVLAVQSG